MIEDSSSSELPKLNFFKILSQNQDRIYSDFPLPLLDGKNGERRCVLDIGNYFHIHDYQYLKYGSVSP